MGNNISEYGYFVQYVNIVYWACDPPIRDGSNSTYKNPSAVQMRRSSILL